MPSTLKTRRIRINSLRFTSWESNRQKTIDNAEVVVMDSTHREGEYDGIFVFNNRAYFVHGDGQEFNHTGDSTEILSADEINVLQSELKELLSSLKTKVERASRETEQAGAVVDPNLDLLIVQEAETSTNSTSA